MNPIPPEDPRRQDWYEEEPLAEKWPGPPSVRLVSGILVLTLAAGLGLLAFCFRADSDAELREVIFWDVVVGILFAVSYLLMRPKGAEEERKWLVPFKAFALSLAIACGLSFWQHAVWWARTGNSERGTTRHRIKLVCLELSNFQLDCGTYPTEQQGLQALLENPGVPGWKGPYEQNAELLKDGWSRPIRYEINNGKPRVWSVGRDGIDGTADDIEAPEGEPGGQIRAASPLAFW